MLSESDLVRHFYTLDIVSMFTSADTDDLFSSFSAGILPALQYY